MRGGHVHNHVLLGPVRVLCRALNLPVQEEVPVAPGRDAGHIDLVIGGGTYRVAVEAECSNKRVALDIAKARAVRAQELWIIVPSKAVKKQVEAVVRENKGAEDFGGLRVLVLFVYETKTRVRDQERLFTCFPVAQGSVKTNPYAERKA